jgi:hypothetical protein
MEQEISPPSCNLHHTACLNAHKDFIVLAVGMASSPCEPSRVRVGWGRRGVASDYTRTKEGMSLRLGCAQPWSYWF